MALIWFEGFEGLGVTEGQANKDNIFTELQRQFSMFTENDSSRPYLRPGSLQGKALAFQNTNTFTATQIRYGVQDLTGTEFVIGFRYKTSDNFTSGTSDIFRIYHETPAGTAHNTIRLDATSNTVILLRGGTTLATSAASVWTDNTWHYYELKMLIADSPTGSYTMRVDDTQIFTATGVDTLDNGTLPNNLLVWSGYDASALDDPDNEAMIDDIYLLDTTGGINDNFLGADTTVVLRVPDADGTTNNFTPQTGVDNFAMVDENPASNADYNDGATNGDIDEYLFTDVDQAGIYGVKIESYVETDTEGRERTYRHRVRSGVSIGNGADIPVVDDVTKFEIFEVDPATSALWVKADLNAAEFGVEVRD